MKFQWSIQSNHTQLVLSQVIYLNYRNEHIWPPTKKWLHIFETFHLVSYNSLHFILRSMSKIFYISVWWTSLCLFKHCTFKYMLLSLFFSQILDCATAFLAQYLFSRFLHWLISIKKKRVGRDIGTSLRMYQNQHDYLIDHKLNDPLW